MSGRDRATPPFDALTKRTDKLHGQMMKEENRLKTNFKGELCYQILQEKHLIPPWLPRTWPQTQFKAEMSREKWLLRFPDKTSNEQRSLSHCFPMFNTAKAPTSNDRFVLSMSLNFSPNFRRSLRLHRDNAARCSISPPATSFGAYLVPNGILISQASSFMPSASANGFRKLFHRNSRSSCKLAFRDLDPRNGAEILKSLEINQSNRRKYVSLNCEDQDLMSRDFSPLTPVFRACFHRNA